MAIIFCDPNIVGGNDDGTSWEDAFGTVQDAVNAASASDDIWIKEGTFTLSSAVVLADQVDLYGSFNSALTSTNGSVAGRDLASDITIIDGNDATSCFSGLAISSCRLDGLKIINGSNGLGNGGGLGLISCSIDIYNCTIQDCAATTGRDGGGISISLAGDLVLNNVTITGCTAEDNGGGVDSTGDSITATNCTFTSNSADGLGGAIKGDSGVDLTMTGCTVSGNSSVEGGGGIHSNSITVACTNCIFDNNVTNLTDEYYGGNIFANGGTFISCVISRGQAYHYGGGVYIGSTNTATFKNCVFADNLLTYSGTKRGSAVYVPASGDLDVFNCIFWGNDAVSTQINRVDAVISVTYSNVEDGYAGDGNINSDPLFVGSGDNPYSISAGSPCIDAGDGDNAPATDILGNARVDDPNTSNTGTGTPAYTDIGAYEYQLPTGNSIFFGMNF